MGFFFLDSCKFSLIELDTGLLNCVLTSPTIIGSGPGSRQSCSAEAASPFSFPCGHNGSFAHE